MASSCLLVAGFSTSASGGGLLLELAYRRGVQVLAGVDPSEAAVSWMRKRQGRLPGSELRLEVGVVEALPFPDASFDAVASTNTVYFWPDLRRAFSELHRVLRPGGLLSVGFSGDGEAPRLRRYHPTRLPLPRAWEAHRSRLRGGVRADRHPRSARARDGGRSRTPGVARDQTLGASPRSLRSVVRAASRASGVLKVSTDSHAPLGIDQAR